VAKRKHIAVVGLGQFGGELARVLAEECEVLAIDIDQNRVDEVVDVVQRAICLDAADLNSLRSVVSSDFDEAVVSTGGTMETSILATLHLQAIGLPIIRVKALSDSHGTILSLVGATEVIFPGRETARRIARTIINPNMLDFVPLEGDYLVRDMVLPKACHGHSLTELDLRRCLDLLILAVRRETEPHFVFLPGPDYVVQPRDVMVTIGREADMIVAERADGLPVCPVGER
jgi:trk system potassium uptake protein